MKKKYDYQPMNAIEYYLHEVARNTEDIVELLKSMQVNELTPEQNNEIKKTIAKVVEKAPVVEVAKEVKPASKPVARKRTTKKE